MSLPTGSTADHERLAEALDAYGRRANVFLAFDNCDPADRPEGPNWPLLLALKSERAAYANLATAASRCGWTYSSDQTCLLFSMRRVATFRRMVGR